MFLSAIKFVALVLLISLISFCQKQDKKDIIATIDGWSLTKAEYNSFWEMRRLYPSYTGEFFPGERSIMTYLIATEIIYREGAARSNSTKIEQDLSWKWKKKYFPAQMYMQKVLDANFGFTDQEIEAYYKAHMNLYKDTIKVDVPVSGKKDSLSSDSSKAKKDSVIQTVKRDSIYQKQLYEVRDQIIKTMFLAKYPPPESLYVKPAGDTSKVDSVEVENIWIYRVRTRLVNFFMEKLYEEKFKQKFPDSLKEWYGKGKIINEDDMNVIMSWLSESQRAIYNTDAGRADLAKWLLKWKLFSEKAKECGFADREDVKNVLNWAWKVEIATYYVNNELVPKAKKGIQIDTQMCVYAMWDERGSVTAKDSAGVNREVTRYLNKAIYNKIDSMIYAKRQNHKIKILLSEYKDEQSGEPKAIIAKADSLRDTGNTAEAASYYRTLVSSFPFTKEGKRAYSELAKVQTDRGEYSDAIKNYRDFLILGNDPSKYCNTFFMIGFIYDEYQNKHDLAEVNYKWVLKNDPECDLADDAEFMIQHLGEPMISIEEIRAEAIRQGRKIDTTAIEEETVTTEKKVKN